MDKQNKNSIGQLRITIPANLVEMKGWDQKTKLVVVPEDENKNVITKKTKLVIKEIVVGV
jgi:hypothetical protein